MGPGQRLCRAAAKRETLSLDPPKFRWKSATSFKKTDLTELTQNQRAQQVNQYYALTPGEPKMTGKQTLRGTSKLSPTGRQSSQSAGAQAFQMASDVIGKSVISSRNKDLGKISDLLIDLAAERPTVAILVVKKRAFALPLHRLTFTSANKLLLDANPAQLEQAKPFSQHEWQLAGAGSGGEIYSYELK